MRHGLLLINKPVGPSSHDIVGRVRRGLNERSVGHLGTLDPNASGLLVLAVGAKGLKIVEMFAHLAKEYVAEVEFGSVSSTYDAVGYREIFPRKPGVSDPLETEISHLLDSRFMGKIFQVPPAHSAVHVDGKRAYALAREGKNFSLPAREIHITACKILSYEYPQLRLRIACGSGTYIRSLAHDLGQLLRIGAYLKNLQRTKVGDWSVEDAVNADNAAWTDVLPLKEVLQDFPKIEVNDAEAIDIHHGRNIRRSLETEVFAWCRGLPIAVLVPGFDNACCHPRKVL